MILLLLAGSALSAQSEAASLAELPNDHVPAAKATPVHPAPAVVSAAYPGGEYALAGYLASTVVYPELAQWNNFEGTTRVRFRVLADGSITDVAVIKSAHALCDAEVVAAVRNMKTWRAARIAGRPVASWRTVAVDFSLR